MNAKKVCRRSFLTMIAAVFITAGFPVPNLTAFAAEKNEVTINATVKNAATLSPKTEYNTVSITDIYDVEILINGKRDTDSAFYVLTKEAFDSLSDKSEEIVRNQSGFTTKDLTGPSLVEDVVFVTYHTFKNEVPVKTKPEAPAREEDKVKETEVVEETVMATCTLPVLVTRSANDIAEYVKIQPQVLEDAPTRTGFTVVEWGGGELETLYLNKTDMIE